MKLTIKDTQGNDRGELEVRFPVVEGGKGTQAVHDVVVAFQAAQRSGTASTKTMGEVAGSGKKPWRQKGTGRARAGSFASPLWRGGGVVFGPKPRDFGKKVSRKTKQLALRKTKGFVKVLGALQLSGTALIVAQGVDKNLTLASRNVSHIVLTTSESL